eukprot:365067-Chlamydomonas_euryale.AAC.30
MKFGGSHLNQRVPVLTLQPRLYTRAGRGNVGHLHTREIRVQLCKAMGDIGPFQGCWGAVSTKFTERVRQWGGGVASTSTGTHSNRRSSNTHTHGKGMSRCSHTSELRYYA